MTNHKMSKPKLIRDFNKVDAVLRQLIELHYPNGFKKDLVTFKNHKNELITALPFETEEYMLMLKMTTVKANLPTDIADATSEDEVDDMMQEMLDKRNELEAAAEEE